MAQKLILSIIHSTDGLEMQPAMGQIEDNLLHRKLNHRYLVHKNYKIIYWINLNKKRVEIVHVFDTRQNPQKINEIK